MPTATRSTPAGATDPALKRAAPRYYGCALQPQSPRPARTGIAALWRSLARMVGGAVRMVGARAATARELEPEHRRDGRGLGTAGGRHRLRRWASGSPPAGPIGRVLSWIAHGLVGSAAIAVPLAFVAGGIHLLRQAPEPEHRGRLLVGGTALTIAVAGLLDLGADHTRTAAAREHAGGVLGYVVAAPLARGLSATLPCRCCSCSARSAPWSSPRRR